MFAEAVGENSCLQTGVGLLEEIGGNSCLRTDLMVLLEETTAACVKALCRVEESTASGGATFAP